MGSEAHVPETEPTVASPMGPAAGPLRLEPTAREVLVTELEGLLAQLGEAARERYAALLEAVRAGAVPEHLAGPLEQFLELGLETGRFRGKYGGYPEESLVRLYHRTPRGTALAESARAVSAALESLAGHTLESIRVAAGAPGSYTLTVDTDRAHLLIRLTRGGARVDTIEVGA